MNNINSQYVKKYDALHSVFLLKQRHTTIHLPNSSCFTEDKHEI